MNLRRFENIEVRLGAPQLLALCVALTFVIFIAYYLGLFAGRSLGIKTALAGTARSVVKIPVASSLIDEELSQSAHSDGVYASLKDEVIPKRLAEASGPVSPKLLSETELIPDTEIEDATDLTNVSLGREKSVAEKPAQKAKTPVKEEQQIARASVTVVEPQAQEPEAETPEKAEFAVQQTLSIRNSETNSLQKGWYSQVLASPDRAESDSIAKKLRSSGFPVVLEEATVRGKKYFRVLVGPESSKPMADRLVDQLEREPAVVSKPFIRVVR